MPLTDYENWLSSWFNQPTQAPGGGRYNLIPGQGVQVGTPYGQGGIGSDANIPMAGQVGQPMQLPGAQTPQGVGATVPSTAGIGLTTAGLSPSIPPWLSNMFRGGGATGGNPPLPANANPLAYGNVTGDDYQKWLAAQTNNATAATANPSAGGIGSSGIGGDWRYPLTNASMASKPYGPNLPPGGMPPGRAKTMGPTASASTPSGAGTPTGQPSATPRPASSNPGFGLFQSQVPGMGVGPMSRNPIYTTRNFFGGGTQPAQQSAAANPANIPASNAQPVSGTLANGGMSNAPWGVGPLQKGMNWPGSYGPSWRDWLASHSGYQ